MPLLDAISPQATAASIDSHLVEPHLGGFYAFSSSFYHNAFLESDLSSVAINLPPPGRIGPSILDIVPILKQAGQALDSQPKFPGHHLLHLLRAPNPCSRSLPVRPL